jgi:hypothetical protein
MLFIIMPRQSDDALSEVIGFILIIALITIFLSLWMTYVIPAEGRQQEIEHMNYVRDWFTQYKITADSLWINHDATNKPLTNVLISNSLSLGSQGGATQAGGLFMPVMSPVGSTGAIVVTDKSEYIEIGGIQYPMMRLEYSATNNYWIPQSFYYQLGGVFLHQPSGTVARVAPLINFGTSRTDIIIIQIASIGSSGISGQGPVRVDTELTNVGAEGSATGSIHLVLQDISEARGWENILKETRFKSGLNSTTCDITRTGSTVNVTLFGGPSNIRFQIVNYTVSVQSIATGVS